MGTPISLIIYNQDQKSKDYSNIKDVFRPNHADITYQAKYGHRDYRGGGRSSARETAMRVAAGAIAKKYLNHHGIHVEGYVSQIGAISADTINLKNAKSNKYFFADDSKLDALNSMFDEPIEIEPVYESKATELFKDSFPKILTVARLEKRKNHQNILMCIKNLKIKFPNIKYISIGDGEEKKSLLELTKSSERKINRPMYYLFLFIVRGN